MHLALVVLALSPSVFEGYIVTVSSRLDVIPRPSLVITTEPPPRDVDPTVRAWTAAFDTDHIYIRKWAVEQADKEWAEYVITHELCHIALRHNTKYLPENWRPEQKRREVEADECAKRVVGKERWEAVFKGWLRMNWRSQRRQELEAVLPSR